nr:radical SAM/SPASM domain-containing protein [uncultured Sediminibacterium sp.]
MRTPVNEKNIQSIKKAYDQKKAVGDFAPSVFVLEPISFCNLSCVMCPNSSLNEDKLGAMDHETFDRLLDKISPFAELTMLYFMGEPLQHPEIGDFLKLARKKLNGRLIVSTNCMLLTDELAKLIIDLSIDVVICCLDHWSKERYEKIRIGGNFETVIHNIENLLSIKSKQERSETNVIVKSLDFGFEENEREEYESYWSSRGGIPLIGWVDSWAGQMPGLRKLNFEPQPYADLDRSECADLWFKMVINWKAEVVLCCHNYDYSIQLGSLLQTDPQTLWQNDVITDFRRKHLEAKFDCNPLCKNCSEWGTLKELDTYVNLERNNLKLVF